MIGLLWLCACTLCFPVLTHQTASFWSWDKEEMWWKVTPKSQNSLDNESSLLGGNYWFLLWHRSQRMFAVIRLIRGVWSVIHKICLYFYPFNKTVQLIKKRPDLLCALIITDLQWGFKRKRNIVFLLDCWAFWGFDGRPDKQWQTWRTVPEGAGVEH